MANYIDDNELFFEIVLSKGKGILSKKAERMFILIGENMIRRKNNMYKTQDDKNDCLQTGLLYMFEKWMNFNEKNIKWLFRTFLKFLKEVWLKVIMS